MTETKPMADSDAVVELMARVCALLDHIDRLESQLRGYQRQDTGYVRRSIDSQSHDPENL